MTTTITFDEFAVGTSSPTYVLADGNQLITSGTISEDDDSGTSPVLGGPGSFNDPVSLFFKDPVTYVAFDVGYLNALGGVRVMVFGYHGELLLDENTSVVGGFENFEVFASNYGVKAVQVFIEGSEPAGFAIDNLVVGDNLNIAPPILDAHTGVLWELDLGQADKLAGRVITGRLGPAEDGGSGLRNDVDSFKIEHDRDVRITFELYSDINQSEPLTYVEDFLTSALLGDTSYFEIESDGIFA